MLRAAAIAAVFVAVGCSATPMPAGRAAPLEVTSRPLDPPAVEPPAVALTPFGPRSSAPPPAEPTAPGLTRGAMERFLPPAPVDIVAKAAREGVLLTWAPGEVAPDAMYADRVTGYRVYRGEGRDVKGYELVARPTVPRWLDMDVRRGASYGYVVTAIYEGDLEGRRPDPIEVRVP